MLSLKKGKLYTTPHISNHKRIKSESDLNLNTLKSVNKKHLTTIQETLNEDFNEPITPNKYNKNTKKLYTTINKNELVY